ncbi:serine/threonine-protein phosphatase 6 regulatory ankyrin repeat subunit B-like [Periplaneta americana]|uniref:serine/threonine-protein phosphatase 6 regulatory ankyrin repeat subunit B-like n=1 Tax=Periplaneta americana TaxID=6978 RepID=UPI0037E70AE5
MTSYFLDLPTININAQDSTGDTPLHVAIQLRHYRIVPLLLKHGATVNIANNRNRTPLHVASDNSMLNECRLIIAHGAQMHKEDAYGETPLSIAVLKRKCYSVANLLLRSGTYVNMFNTTGFTLLGEAVLHATLDNDLRVIEYLIKNGAVINVGDTIGKRTPLHLTAISNNVNVAKFLLENGADPTILNRERQLPRTTALLHSNFEVVDLLEGYEI